MATGMLTRRCGPATSCWRSSWSRSGVSQYQLGTVTDMPTRGINGIVHGQRRIRADTALRLARYFGTSERFWMNLQLAMTSRPRKTGSNEARRDNGRTAR